MDPSTLDRSRSIASRIRGRVAATLGSSATAAPWVPWGEDEPSADVLRRTLVTVAALLGLTIPFGRPPGGGLAVVIVAEVLVVAVGFALWRRLASPLTVMRYGVAGSIAVMTFGIHSMIQTIASGGVAPLGLRLLAYGAIVTALSLLVGGTRIGTLLSVATQAVWLGVIAARPATRELLQTGGDVLVAMRYNLILLVLLAGVVQTYGRMRQERDRMRERAHRAEVATLRFQQVEQQRERRLAEAAHELRGPLSTVAMGAETLAMHEDALDRALRQRIVTTLRNAAERLDERTYDLLEAARGRDAQPLQREIVDPVVAVRRTLDDLSLMTGDHDLCMQGSEGQEALLDPAALDHIVTNLVGNAIKYAPAGTTIDVSVSRDGPVTVLVVADHGPGVPEDVRDVLFVPYERSQLHAGIEGSGCGLAIVRAWARRHGGDARLLDSEEGAVFEVRLPDG